jgi:hypothetical protein
MLCPHGPHLGLCGKLAACFLRKRGVKVGFFLGRERGNWRLCPDTLQQQMRKLVLHVVGEGRYRRNGLFKVSGSWNSTSLDFHGMELGYGIAGATAAIRPADSATL